MTANVDTKALFDQLKAQASAQFNGAYLTNVATTDGVLTGGYGHQIATTSFLPVQRTTTYPNNWGMLNTVDPKDARIKSLEERVDALETIEAVQADKIDTLMTRLHVLEELVEKLTKPSASNKADDNSAGAVLGRAISKHW